MRCELRPFFGLGLLVLGLIVLTLPLTAMGSEFANAVPGRHLAFPRDHGKHPDFQTEWWYFTGNLRSLSNRWGFQLTFFRRALARRPAPWHSDWTVRDVYPAHFALTDIGDKRFFHTELMSREGPGLAAAASDTLDVHVRDWRASLQGDTIRLHAQENDYALDLKLVPQKAPVLHGDGGYSIKGGMSGQASYYYSLTRLTAEGTVRFEGITHEVSGLAWMDHEFGSSILLPDQAGWDWLSVQLDDGSELMLFYLRNKDGSRDKIFGTLVPRTGSPIDLDRYPVVVTATGTWKSPRTGATYPSRWEIRIPDLDVELSVKPALSDQELSSDKSTSIVYWEGSVDVKGSRKGRAVSGRGYVELTGYAHSMGGRL